MKYLPVLIVLLVFTTRLWAQGVTPTTSNTTFIFIDQSPTINYKYHDGTALLTDGTWLKGRFQYNGKSTFKYRASSQATQQRIGLSMISRLALAGADTSVMSRTDSTVFLRLGNRLYRQLAGGLPRVLDRRFLVNEVLGKIGRKMYIQDSTGHIRWFTSLQKLNRWFYAFQERSGTKKPDTYLNENEIVKALAKRSDE